MDDIPFDAQVRQLKAKLAKSESREKRRTQSLKGRESFQLSKEVEDKLVDLEAKMTLLVGASPTAAGADAPTSEKKVNIKLFRSWGKMAKMGSTAPLSEDPLPKGSIIFLRYLCK